MQYTARLAASAFAMGMQSHPDCFGVQSCCRVQRRGGIIGRCGVSHHGLTLQRSGIQSSAFSATKKAFSSTSSVPNAAAMPFRLDAPFTPVPGEQKAIDAILRSSSTASTLLPDSRGGDGAHVGNKTTGSGSRTIGAAEGDAQQMSHAEHPTGRADGRQPSSVEDEQRHYTRVVYRCQRCQAALFRSDDLISASRSSTAASSTAPIHVSGWPTFSAPIQPSALQYRTRLQRQTIAVDSNTTVCKTEQGVQPAKAHMQMPDEMLKTSFTSATTLVSRPLSVEGDQPSQRRGSGSGGAAFVSRSLALSPLEAALQQHRRRGQNYRQKQVTTASPLLRGSAFAPFDLSSSARHNGKTKRWNMTWRERCLRDVNQRADPSYVEGCCRSCGTAVCRVVELSKGAGVHAVGYRRRQPASHGTEVEERVSGNDQSLGKYVSTGSVLIAEPSE